MTPFEMLDRIWREERDAWTPFGPYSDLECTSAACTNEALVEDGVRIATCESHLRELEHLAEPEGLFTTRAALVRRDIVVDSRDLSLQQRAWIPGNAAESAREWPHADRIEVWANTIMFENRWHRPWSWRSVAMAARTYPNRPVRLVGHYLQVPLEVAP
jgi:hypothetical protein